MKSLGSHNLARIMGNSDGITVWNADALMKKKAKNFPLFQILSNIIDELGEYSAKAQNLPHIITSTSKLITTGNILYLYACEGNPVGMLKVGTKKLFYQNERATYDEIEPLCVLDFYVNEKYQRKGIGKELFEYMLRDCNIVPWKIAYDRPSPKLLAFLAKHYSLKNYIPQSNNFVIYKKYFSSIKENKDNMIMHSQDDGIENGPGPFCSNKESSHVSSFSGSAREIHSGIHPSILAPQPAYYRRSTGGSHNMPPNHQHQMHEIIASPSPTLKKTFSDRSISHFATPPYKQYCVVGKDSNSPSDLSHQHSHFNSTSPPNHCNPNSTFVLYNPITNHFQHLNATSPASGARFSPAHAQQKKRHQNMTGENPFGYSSHHKFNNSAL